MRNIECSARLAARSATIIFLVSLLLSLVAGGLHYPSLRCFLIIFSAALAATMFGIDPGLAEERSHPFHNASTKERFATSACFLATLGLAALDVGRLHWFDSVCGKLRASGLLLFAGAAMLQWWAMITNPFFSPEIRLQTEREHRLITAGPYQFLRHPGYFAMLVSVPASAIAIGSWLALVPAASFFLVIAKRVRAEESFLKRNLPGYEEYMRQVPGALVPQAKPARADRK
jgi:protein-S-isoprenylcysteine O-methyltransferase Ste14